MTKSLFFGLFQNVAILLSFSMLYNQFWIKRRSLHGSVVKILMGVVLGFIGIVIISTPWYLVPGIFFDCRSIILSISGLFFGLIPTATAMLIMAVYRFILGGNGVAMGLAVIFFSGTIGILWKNLRPNWKKREVIELLSLGIVVHIITIGCTLLLPASQIVDTIKAVALPVIIVYPLGTILLGKLFLYQEENHRKKEELDESEERWHFALEGAGDGVFDSNFETSETYFSPVWKSILGYLDDELKNTSDEWEKRIHPDDKERVLELLNKHLEGNSPIYLAEYRLQSKNGDYKWILARGKVIKRSFEGKALRIIGTHSDITENKLNQEKINKINLHYQALIEKASDGIILIDKSGNLKYASPSVNRILGYPENEKISIKPINITHPDDHLTISTAIQELEDIPIRPKTIQYRLKDKAGNWLWIEGTFRNLLSDSNVEAIVINFRNITESKKAEEEAKQINEILEQKVRERTIEIEKKQADLVANEAALLNLVEDLNFKSEELRKSTILLEAANKELEAFTYSVSHDLRSPLRAISGFVNILTEDYSQLLDEEGKRICAIIQANAVKMGQLIDDLLAFSRLIKSDITLSEISMNDMVRNVLSEFETTMDLSARKITIKELPLAHCDKNMIKQVWINLISNALKYTSKNEKIEIEIGSYSVDHENVYYIKDNGVGFNMDYAHKLFGVFQRLHNIKDFEGTGVGLAIVQRIVTRHQGKVWAEGEVNKGACFYFALPSIL